MAKAKTGSVVDTATYEYKKFQYRTPDGKLHTVSSNLDAVAKAMIVLFSKGGTIKEVIAANDLGPQKGGNEGLLRMKVGNVLRGLVRNETAVKIGTIKVSSLKQAVALPELKPGATRNAPATKPKAAKKVKAKKTAKKAKRKSNGPATPKEMADASVPA